MYVRISIKGLPVLREPSPFIIKSLSSFVSQFVSQILYQQNRGQIRAIRRTSTSLQSHSGGAGFDGERVLTPIN